MGFSTRTISQEAFDALVAENISDLSMDPEEALENAVQTLTLHSIDLSGIVKCFPRVNCLEDNPMMRSLDGLKKVSARLEYSETESSDLDEVVYGYARRFAKIGIVDALVDAFHEGIGSFSLVYACIVLKAIFINDEICRSISSKGGIDEILQCIDDGSVYNNKDVAKTCCSVRSKLARSDANKNAMKSRHCSACTSKQRMDVNACTAKRRRYCSELVSD